MEAKKLIITNETTKTQYYTFAHPPNELMLESGEKIGPLTLAFETYGQLNTQKSNAILVLHALSGDAHAAGNGGWWENLIGKGRGIDTDKFFVICSNVIGGCKGSSGSASIDTKTGKPYGLTFPLIGIRDMVETQKRLIEHLGVDRLLSVVGGSMGGMQVLQWMASYPEKIYSAIPIATTLKHTPQQIAFNEVGRQAVMSDPYWKNGNYYNSAPPSKGLALARMIGHITYMSDISMTEKFGRKTKADKKTFKFSADFEVEGYLRYKGDNFVKRFDANSYLYLTKAIDNFNLLNGHHISSIFRGLKAKVLVLAFKSDWLYPPYESQEIVKACKLAGVEASYCEITSTYGHDSFLLDTKQEAQLIKDFLKAVANGNRNNDRI
jgi:homoserine O-acetyltransferase